MAGKIDKSNFGEGSVPKIIMRIALPLMAAELVHILYNMVDKIFIGHLPEIGTVAYTGVGVVFPIITLINSFASLSTSGAVPICSIARGEGNKEKAQGIMQTAFTMLLVIGVVLTIVLSLIAPWALRILGGDEETLPYALEYFRIYALGIVPVLISLGMNGFITSQGFSTTGTLSVVIGAALNTILDPLFMFVFDMGVAGAAIATVISQTASAVWVLIFLFGNKPPIRISKLEINKNHLANILKLGATGFMFKITNSLTASVVNITLKSYAGDAVSMYIAASSTINSVKEISGIPMTAINSGSQPVESFNYGAKKWGRLNLAMKTHFILSMSINVFMWIIQMTGTSIIAGLFTPGNEELIALTVSCARKYYIMYPFMTLHMMGQHTFVALNKPKFALFFSTLRKLILVLPLTLLLPKFFGVDGVFYAEAVSQFVGPVACFTTMFFTQWKPIMKLAKEEVNG